MNENIGGMIENIKNKNTTITPENRFRMELVESFRFLDSYISKSEFDKIFNSLDKFKFFTSMNPNLIILGFILKKGEMTINDIMKAPSISPILEENNISPYDIIRYMRYFNTYLPEIRAQDDEEDF